MTLLEYIDKNQIVTFQIKHDMANSKCAIASGSNCRLSPAMFSLITDRNIDRFEREKILKSIPVKEERC